MLPQALFRDGPSVAFTWDALLENVKRAVYRFKEAVDADRRPDFIARAEDVSDHLRLLLAAATGTTDSHTGSPAAIAANKALYPHFREIMSSFSKLVLSSHIAAADWPGPESSAKCLQEADGVLQGVYGFVEVARHQRGDDIPRLLPGFVAGSQLGGHWRDNNIDDQYLEIQR